MKGTQAITPELNGALRLGEWPRHPPPDAAGEDDRASRSLLIVEDDRDLLALLLRIGGLGGYSAVGADTMAHALEALASRRFNAALVDLTLGGDSGLDLIKHLKSQDPDIEVIVISASSSVWSAIQSYELEAFAFVPKPFDIDQLFITLARALERRRIAIENRQLVQQLRTVNTELSRVNAELTIALDQLNAATSEQEVVEQVLARALELPGVETGWVWLSNGASGFRCAAARNVPPALEAPEALEGECHCQRLLLSGALDGVGNILECERLQSAKGDTRGLRCHASVPLRAGDRKLGILNLAGPGGGLFTEDHLRVLYTIGNMLGLALERARLYEHLERLVDERTAALREEIRHRKLAEEALRRSEEYFRSLIEDSTDLITVIGADGRLHYQSPSVARVLGYLPEELVDQNAFAFVHPADLELVRERFSRYSSRRGVTWPIHQLRLRHKDGSWRVIEAVGRTVEDERGLVAIFNSRDVTEQTQLQQQLWQAQKMDAVGGLAAGIAHDFNNLLTAILGYAELLLSDLGDDDPRRGDLDEIKKAAELAASLTRKILAFSRKQPLEPEVLDLNALVTTTHDLLSRLIGENIRLNLRLDPDLGRVKTDATQVEQILLNLATNARDAMPEGGALTIETRNAALDETHVRNQPSVAPGEYIMLAVSDTGCGMTPEVQARVFEPFFTTKPRGVGTGLGLSTVYGIVKQSGGYIWIYSEPQRGATFKVYLPRVDAPATAWPAPVRPEVAVSGTATVLLVEDNRGLRALARKVLERKGYAVLEAGDADEALRVSEQHAGPIHLLLTDAVMPGMSGAALAGRLTSMRPAMKVLFMSGYTDEMVITVGVDAARPNFLQKPFTADGLARKVRQVLGATQSEQDSRA